MTQHRELRSLRPHLWPSPCTDTHPNRCVLSICYGHPEPDTAPPSVNDPPDDGQLWGGLIGYKPSYTTSARKKSSGARPSGDAPRKQIFSKTGGSGTWPICSEKEKVDAGETKLRNWGCFEVLGGTRHQLGGIGSGPTVRLAYRRAGRPRSRPSGTTETAGKKPPEPRHPFRPLLRPTTTMPPPTPRRLRRHAPQPAPGPPPRRKPRHPNPRW